MREWRGRQQQQQEGGWWGPTNRHTRRKYGRPPPSPTGSWHQTVPLWEKKFCTDVCLIPWRKLCETKRVMSMYENVVQWNDSAGEEAFKDAKARFWAEINGLPCDIPLPDPDMYIDVVNQEAFINPQLVEDLYKQPSAPDDSERDASCGWDSFIFADRPVPVSGWGDTEDPVPTGWLGAWYPVPTEWKNTEDPIPTNNATTEPHSVTSDNNVVFGKLSYRADRDTGGSKKFDSVNASEKAVNKGISNSARGNAWNPDGLGTSWEHRESRNTEPGGRFSRIQNGGSVSSRYARPRDQEEDHQTNGWRNCRGRKKNEYRHH